MLDLLDLLESPGSYANAASLWSARCSRCGEIKLLAEFPIKNKTHGTRRVWCRDCCRAYGREHYRRNRPIYLAKNRARRQSDRPRVRALIDEYLRHHPCVDCGRADITVLEFDHRRPSEKNLSVGRIALMGSWPSVLREIEKCDVRCANCHRMRTAAQFGWTKLEGAPPPAAAGPARYATLDDPIQDELFGSSPDGLRFCSDCGLSKPPWAFAFRDIRTGARQHHCRSCKAAYRRRHYERNKPDYVSRAIAQTRGRRDDSRRQLQDFLRAHPCVDCGETNIVVLEFDHVDPQKKAMDIGTMMGNRSWAKILDEIEKCEVRCANCHRLRTAVQRGWKHRLAEDRVLYGRMTRYAGVA